MKTVAQERYWEVLSFFGGSTHWNTDARVLLHDAKRDRIIIAGLTQEKDMPVTPNAMKSSLNDRMDGYLAVFNSDCSELVYSTYIGGSENDAVIDGVLLDDDRLLLLTDTWSTDFIATGDAWDTVAGGEGDSWLSVFSLDDYQLLHAGYFGGSNTDAVENLLKMKDGSIVMTGMAASNDLPVTPDAFQSRKRGYLSSTDAFIAIYDSTFKLRFCSYHGGMIGDGENARNGVVETRDHIVFAGTVRGTDMPVTDNAYQKTWGGGWDDAYLTVISKDSLKRVYSTYLGGSEGEHFNEITAVGDNRLILVGSTKSFDFPITSNAWQPACADSVDCYDVLIGVFSLDSMRFEELTFMGGNSVDFAKSVIYDPSTDVASILVRSASFEYPLLPEKSPDCDWRGAVINYDPTVLEPVRAMPIVDVGDNAPQRIIKTSTDRILFCGRATQDPTGGPVQVRLGGHRAIFEGETDVFIGELHDTPVYVRSLSDLPLPEKGIAVHPQPAQEALRFILNSSEDATVMLYDLLGRYLKETRVHSNGQGGHGMLRLDEVSPGVYLLVARTRTDVHTRKVVVAR